MKKHIVILCIICLVLLSGCENESLKPTGIQESLNSSEAAMSQEAGEEVATASNIPIQNGDKTQVKTEVFSQIDGVEGQIQSITYVKDSLYLIAADNLCLYDVAKGKVTVTQELALDFVDNMKVIEGGLAVIGYMHDDVPEYHCMIYDNQLQLMNDYNVNELLLIGDDIFLQGVDISSDGSYIAVINIGLFLYVYNIKTQKCNLVIDASTDDFNLFHGLCSIDKICFWSNSTRIAFYGQRFQEENVDNMDGTTVIGSVGVDSTNYNIQDVGNFVPQRIDGFDEFALFSEDTTAEMINGEASGEVLKYENDDTVSRISLKEKNESEAVYPSNNGTYLASIVCKNEGWVIRIYNTAKGEQISKLEIKAVNAKVNSNTRPRFYFYEDSGDYLFYQKDYEENDETQIQIGELSLLE